MIIQNNFILPFFDVKVAAISELNKMKSVRNARLARNCIVRKMATTTQSTKQLETASTCIHAQNFVENADALVGAKGNVAKRVENVRPYSEVPGPTPLPILGNTWRWVATNGGMLYRLEVECETSCNLFCWVNTLKAARCAPERIQRLCCGSWWPGLGWAYSRKSSMLWQIHVFVGHVKSVLEFLHN